MKILNCIFLLLFSCNIARAATDIGQWDMTINGRVLANPCYLLSSNTETVILGEYRTSDFPSPGSVGNSTFLTIIYNCGLGDPPYTLRINGQADVNDPQLLALSGSGSMATNLAIEIRDYTPPGTDRIVPINTTIQLSPINPGGDSRQVVNLGFRYKSTQYPVQSGNASAVLTFEIVYP